MAGQKRTLGAVITDIRTSNGWTLKEMSQRCGIPVSTLSKVEHDRLSLTYDKLQRLGERLNISMADFFAEQEEAAPPPVLGRRSIGTLANAVRVNTRNYDYHYVCTELRNRRMIPVITHHHARSLAEFGPLIRHSGEEFVYVIKGTIVVHTEFYDPVELKAGESIYIDSGMGHAYVRGKDCEEALTLGVMSSAEEDLSAIHLLAHDDEVHPALVD